MLFSVFEIQEINQDL